MHLLYLLLATIPLHLPVDISRPTSPAFPAYHGETLEIEAELKDRGTAFNVALTSPQLYYQTPGMGNSWWTLPATQTNNLLRATFPASADPGEDRLICFLGSAGENFRAAFILNFRHSPGAVPNTVELPSPTLDFSQITILNSPYETIEAAASAHTNLTSQISAVQSDVQAVSNALVAAEADLSAQIAAATPDDYNTVKGQVSTNADDIATLKTGKQDSIADLSDIRAGAALGATALQSFAESDPTVPSWAKADNKPTYAYSEITGTPTIPTVPTTVSSFTNDVGYLTSYTETDPTISSWAKASTKPTYTLNEVAPDTENWLGVPGTTIAGKSIKVLAKTVNGVIEGGVTVTGSSNNDNNTTKYRYGGVSVKRNGTNTDYLFDTSSQSGIVRRSELGDYATTSALADKADAAQVTTIVNYLEGNDARVIITNYDSQVEMPALSFEQKTGTVWRTIWDEATRWGAHDLDEQAYRAATSNSVESLATQLEGKADRAWGFYESNTGNYAPDGYTWISSPKIAIAGGMAYERHITSDGAIWLLESNGLGIELTGTTNGFFRVADDEDNVLFEIVKGERRTVGALGDHVAVTNGTLYAHYSVISAEHPTIYACTNLTTLAGFIAETEQACPCTVAWSGTSGNWTAAVTAKGPTPNIFAKAEYTVGGETYIHNAAPTKLDYLMIGNTKYSLGTATISGSTVLTLTEVP